ncbi:MAG: DUF447 domain-containing protein [Pirellulales bacterium]
MFREKTMDDTDRDQLILEGIVTTVDPSDRVNIAPMGPVVDREIDRVRFRPFQTSATFRNLEQTRQGVLHVTDDVELFAQSAVDRLEGRPAMFRATAVDGYILADACRWYAFRVESIDKRETRAEVEVRVVDRGTQRDFFGFNRAKHAVLEAAILATRLEFTPAETMRCEFDRLAVIVKKTAGAQERNAFALLERYVDAALGDP